MSSAADAIASAYARQLAYPQRLHCVCGSTASRRRTSGGISALTSLFYRSASRWLPAQHTVL